jgi:hypothetical protein
LKSVLVGKKNEISKTLLNQKISSEVIFLIKSFKILPNNNGLKSSAASNLNNRTVHIRYLCRKRTVFGCHRCQI